LDLPRSCFISPAEVEEARLYVEARWPSKGKGGQNQSGLEELDKEDIVEPGLPLPNSVVNGCETSFIAANKNQEKGSPGSFASTGLMTLNCCHDRVLRMVNLTTAGEQQYYAIALLTSLFKELPSWWKMGILYDIACVLHRSMSRVCVRLRRQ
jgi:Kyakuja-Dileera-Zisupton transposase